MQNDEKKFYLTIIIMACLFALMTGAISADNNRLENKLKYENFTINMKNQQHTWNLK